MSSKQNESVEAAFPPSRDFPALVLALSRPKAFSFTLPDDEAISVIQTHASIVLLTPELVYKLKKPKDFGFFDFSTPTRRRHFCIQEVLLNTRLAPGIYLGVAPVLLLSDGQVCFGPTLSVDAVPLPGTSLNSGTVVDYAVVMVRLPDEAMLEVLVQTERAAPALLAEIGRYVAKFHSTAQTDKHIASFGKLEVIRGNWEENFAQMRPYIGRTLGQATYDNIVSYVRQFMKARQALFAYRIRSGRIRDCHGDLRLQHVYLLHTPTDIVPGMQLPRLAILDGIEFNERFRYGDVASEIAFLAMELDAAGRSDLSRAFVDAYVAATGDDVLRELLPFYCCYRACVRGKVLSFQLDEPEVPAEQREAARQQAAGLFALAASYAGGPTRPILMMVGGVMGTGKSTLARALRRELGWALFSSDTLRKCLAHLNPTQPQPLAFGQGLYSPQWTARTYHALQNKACTELAAGRSVLLDASFIRRSDRQAMMHMVGTSGASVVFVECYCPREVALQRLARRWQARTQGNKQTGKAASFASDGRPDLYDAQCSAYEDFDAREESRCAHILTSTEQPLAVNVEQVLDALHMPRFTCRLPRRSS
jgi:uncharacterized protein